MDRSRSADALSRRQLLCVFGGLAGGLVALLAAKPVAAGKGRGRGMMEPRELLDVDRGPRSADVDVKWEMFFTDLYALDKQQDEHLRGVLLGPGNCPLLSLLVTGRIRRLVLLGLDEPRLSAIPAESTPFRLTLALHLSALISQELVEPNAIAARLVGLSDQDAA